MKKKKLKGYLSLKEARAVAREMTSYYGCTDIYLESDGSYSVGKPCDKKAKFYCAIDRAGARYTKVWEERYGRKMQVYKRVK